MLHKKDRDRLINDRRPFNKIEVRLAWSRLPHGSMLTRLIIEPHQHAVASGDDLSDFFHSLKHNPDFIPRNYFGRPLKGKDYLDWGGSSGRHLL